jgi:alpha-D-ribose 1-methylphosphonate 5-triphosphate synthase subunit PhnH
MTVTPTLPGFKDPVHNAQQTFRGLMESLAQPGQPRQIPVKLSTPDGLTSACAAACLSLLDFETTVWIQPGLGERVYQWLLFHTGCRIVKDPWHSTFAIIHHSLAMPDLSRFSAGTAEFPENSTTLLLQVKDFDQGHPVILRGPGIQTIQQISPQLPVQFWQQWQANTARYPLGVDIFLFAKNSVIGLPRATQVEVT